MIEELAKDYATYLKLDVSGGFQSVQDVIDNMLTRLEELTSVLHMVKSKNSDCNSIVSEDIIKYRGEISTLSKKITTLSEVVSNLLQNIDVLEKQVEKAEADFGINHDNKIKTFLKPFLKRNKEVVTTNFLPTLPPVNFKSVMDNFETK